MTRTYVVTGAASGIGATTADLLRADGARVIGVDLRGTEVEADLSTEQGRLVAAAQATALADGVLDGVVACAGTMAPLALTISVNYFGVVGLLDALQPALSRSQAPRAAVVSSVASLQYNSAELVDAALSGDETKALAIAATYVTDNPMTAYVIYSSSKRALARWVRRESVTERWAGAGIALNAVGPGTVRTPMSAGLLATPDGVAMADAAVPMPLNYHQPPESIGNLLMWLTSPQNTHVTGQVIYDDGGADAVLRGDDIWSWCD